MIDSQTCSESNWRTCRPSNLTMFSIQYLLFPNLVECFDILTNMRETIRMGWWFDSQTCSESNWRTCRPSNLTMFSIQYFLFRDFVECFDISLAFCWHFYVHVWENEHGLRIRLRSEFNWRTAISHFFEFAGPSPPSMKKKTTATWIANARRAKTASDHVTVRTNQIAKTKGRPGTSRLRWNVEKGGPISSIVTFILDIQCIEDKQKKITVLKPNRKTGIR